MIANGDDQMRPCMAPYEIISQVVCVQAAFGALLAIRARQTTGQGQHVEIAQVEGTAHLLGVAYMDYLLNGRVAQPKGNFSTTQAPHDVYPCQDYDAWCAIEVGTEKEWQSLVRAMGNLRWPREERFQTIAGRIANKEELDRHLGEWTRNFTPRPLMLTLQKAGVPAGIVANGEDLYHDLHLRSRPGAIVSIDHPGVGLVDYKGVNVRLSATPGWGGESSPTRGEHNTCVFKGEL